MVLSSPPDLAVPPCRCHQLQRSVHSFSFLIAVIPVNSALPDQQVFLVVILGSLHPTAGFWKRRDTPSRFPTPHFITSSGSGGCTRVERDHTHIQSQMVTWGRGRYRPSSPICVSGACPHSRGRALWVCPFA